MAGVALKEVLVFGGASEGRMLVEWLSAHGGFEVWSSALTDYGSSLVEGLPRVHSLSGRMAPVDMEALIRGRAFACVVDATHPYAAGVSRSIAQAAGACGLEVLRVVREGEPEGPWKRAADAASAAGLLAGMPGRILFTTGSKDLPTYAAALPDFAERSFVRVLPVASSLAAAADLGLGPSHIVAMQGPFSQGFNEALIRELGIDIVVTKASGNAGGFWEKAEAARACGAGLVVVGRPVVESGLSLEQAKRVLEELA